MIEKGNKMKEYVFKSKDNLTTIIVKGESTLNEQEQKDELLYLQKIINQPYEIIQQEYYLYDVLMR